MMPMKLTTKIVKFVVHGIGVQALGRVNMAILWTGIKSSILPYKIWETLKHGYDVQEALYQNCYLLVNGSGSR